MSSSYSNSNSNSSSLTSVVSSGISGMAGSGAGQSLSDRMNAARYAIAGQGLNRVVCKATTEEILGPKKKHLDCELFIHPPNYMTSPK